MGTWARKETSPGNLVIRLRPMNYQSHPITEIPYQKKTCPRS